MSKTELAHSNNIQITVAPETASVPRGKIVTDDFRGTAFWEVADSSDEDDAVETAEPRWSLPFPLVWIKK
jgi:hypothetical protein